MEQMENFIKVNFLPIWHHFLFFEMNRSRAGLKMAGSANGFLVLQVICWHHILVLMGSSQINYKGMFREEAVELWNKFGKIGFDTNTVLTYTLVSELTGLSIETVRRQVMKLQNNNWVQYSKRKGIKFQPSEENNKFLVDHFNAKEIKTFGHLLDIIEQKK
jgi:hypothetical protein